MNDAYRYRGRDQRTTLDADQAEKDAYRNGSVAIDRGIADDLIADVFDDENIPENRTTGQDELEEWHKRDLVRDTNVGAVHEELVRRHQMLTEHYPFEIEGNSLRYKGTGLGIYEFLLCISTAPSITVGKYVWLPRLFERVITKIAASYFGAYVSSMHFGKPRTPEGENSFVNAAKQLSQFTGEFEWQPSKILDPTYAGDQGVDFVFWPPNLDGRKIAQQFFLGQCACGNDWESKLHDLDIKKFYKWFDATVVDPVRLFATPFHLVDGVLIESSREAGYIFDRARIVATFEKVLDQQVIASYRSDLDKMTRQILCE